MPRESNRLELTNSGQPQTAGEVTTRQAFGRPRFVGHSGSATAPHVCWGALTMTKTSFTLVAAAVVVACNTDLGTPTQPRPELSRQASSSVPLPWRDYFAHEMRPFGAAGLDGGNPDTTDPILYYGGPVIHTPKVAVLYWSNRTIYQGGPAPGSMGDAATDTSLMGFFLKNLGGSNYHNIMTTYYDGSGYVQNSLHYTRFWATTNNAPVAGDTVHEAIIRSVLGAGFNAGSIPNDPDSTMYVVVTDSGVNWGLHDGFFEAGAWCAYHDTMTVQGYTGTYKYIALPHQYDRTNCTPQTGSPNNDPAGDAVLNALVHEIEETTTDPEVFNVSTAWRDYQGNEVGDKCHNLFAPGYPVPGANANLHLGPTPGGKDVYIQRMWKNLDLQQCAFFSLTMSGPTSIMTSGNYTWTAHPGVSPSGYTYRWWYQNQGSSTWNPLQIGQSQSRTLSMSDPNFTIMDSTKNNVGQIQVATRFVTLHPPPSVELSGPTLVWEGQACTWTGAVVAGGTPPYTYEWDVYGDGVSNPVQVDNTSNASDDLVYQVQTVGDSITIAVGVTDAVGQGGGASLAVYSGGYGCGFRPQKAKP
jgi:hypothetical protein